MLPPFSLPSKRGFPYLVSLTVLLVSNIFSPRFRTTFRRFCPMKNPSIREIANSA